MYRPYISDESDQDSESGTGSVEESELEGSDAQMASMDRWRAATQAMLPTPARSAQIPLAAPDVAVAATEYNHGQPLENTRLSFEEKRVTHVVMVNSLDRDQKVYPLPTQVSLQLPRVYKKVERIDIVQVKFFCGVYAISAARKNNTLIVGVGIEKIATIPDGTYTLSQLCAAIQTALPVGYGFAVTFNPVAGRITIAATTQFSLLFQSSLPSYAQQAYSEWGLGWNLGFGGQPQDLTGSTTYTADHFPRLGDDYLYLQLNEPYRMNDVDHTALQNTAKTQDSAGQVAHYFGKLLLNNFGCWAQTFVEAPKTFKPVLGQLERLDFTWTDRLGQTLLGPDAASCDWHMALRLTEVVEVPLADSTLT
jgi:hypothetical protein